MNGQEVRGRGGPSVSAELLSPPHGRPWQGLAQRLDPLTGEPRIGRGNRCRRAATARERVRGSGGAIGGPFSLLSELLSLTLLLLFFFFFFFLFLEGALRVRTRSTAQREL